MVEVNRKLENLNKMIIALDCFIMQGLYLWFKK